ncbi:hypothetical protein [Ralstonia solanacearum]|uniref:Uncharacterized protein n=1 Tax=Ralstonia solanacearum CFBP2957 TaxID=859656 RepID=D8P771_RALSL|nr:hypothetical protein [Ralstonia solanacearum]CBJ52905.1 protein of unknown function [Ralstonia solanacearum CFBP2957]
MFSLEAQLKSNPAAQCRVLANRFIPIPKLVLLSDIGNRPDRWSINRLDFYLLQSIKGSENFRKSDDLSDPNIPCGRQRAI